MIGSAPWVPCVSLDLCNSWPKVHAALCLTQCCFRPGNAESAHRDRLWHIVQRHRVKACVIAIIGVVDKQRDQAVEVRRGEATAEGEWEKGASTLVGIADSIRVPELMSAPSLSIRGTKRIGYLTPRPAQLRRMERSSGANHHLVTAHSELVVHALGRPIHIPNEIVKSRVPCA